MSQTPVLLSSEMLKAALTVAGGVLILVVGQIVQRLLIEPIHEQRKTIGEIAFALLMHGNVGQVAEIQAQGMAVVEPIPPLEVVKTIRALGGSSPAESLRHSDVSGARAGARCAVEEGGSRSDPLADSVVK